MKRTLGTTLYVAVLVLLGAAWVRSAWLMPLRNYPFDFSINYTGARLLRAEGHAADLYDRAALAEEAAPYTYYPVLYTKLFLTYIQTPLTAVLILPVASMSLDDAQTVLVTTSNILLVASVAIVILTLGPSRLLVLAAFVIFATYEAMFDSLRLGNVDALIVFCLALSFLALRRGRPWLIGAPLAAAAILKMSPVIVIGYFAFRREWRVLAGALLGSACVLVLSLAVAGPQNHVTFVRETLPLLSKGSTFYDNISLGGALARWWFGPTSWYYEDEVSDWPLTLRALSLVLTAAIVLGAYAVSRRDREAGFMLATAVAVLVAPISWSFYPTWLIPSLLFLVARFSTRRAWGRLALLCALYPLLAIVPAHFSAIDEEIYRYPIKTAALALYCALLAWEAGRGAREVVSRQPAEAAPAAVGAPS
jgi:Glycosyltransferase family 87